MKQRPIKFRVWDKKNKSMALCVYRLDLAPEVVGVYGEGMGVRRIDDVELMQFTGLTDKNGKEIYEGDIVKMEVHYRYKLSEKQPWGPPVKVPVYSNYVVEYRQEDLYAGLYFRRLDDEPRYYEMGSDEKEVIGNIYENPELIKQS